MGCSIEQARIAKEKAKKLLQQYGPIVGVGITRIGDGYGVKVNLETAVSEDLEFPPSVDGVPIVFEVTGKIRKR
jgi:hypothetical protein